MTISEEKAKVLSITERSLKEDFDEYEERLNWLYKTSTRLMEIEREYNKKSTEILQKAIADGVDFKALYGGNSEKTRKKYVDEQLSELLIEKERLKLFKEDDNRRIGLIKRVIDLKILIPRAKFDVKVARDFFATR